MVNKTIKTYLCFSNNNTGKSINKTQNGSQRSYSTYNLKSYPFYHETKVSNDLMNQRKLKYQIASSHGNNGDGHSVKSDYYKHRKYHRKNEFNHFDSFDNKPIFQHMAKHNNQIKTVGELKEDYRRLVEESKRTAPKVQHIKGQEKMKDFSLGVD
ncbi:hypothetical protein ACTA71_007095 [Dictyostelium dimigraforme]